MKDVTFLTFTLTVTGVFTSSANKQLIAECADFWSVMIGEWHLGRCRKSQADIEANGGSYIRNNNLCHITDKLLLTLKSITDNSVTVS